MFWKIEKAIARSISRYLIKGPWDASKSDKAIALFAKKFFPSMYYQMVEIHFACKKNLD